MLLVPPAAPSVPPHRLRSTSRNFSRSSGLIRWRQRGPRGPRGPPGPRPPNKMRHNNSRPSPSQNVIWCHPKIEGSNQFHNRMTTSPPTKINATIATGIRKKNHRFSFLIFCSSFAKELVVNALQALAQVQHCIPLAREQGVDAHPGFLR